MVNYGRDRVQWLGPFTFTWNRVNGFDWLWWLLVWNIVLNNQGLLNWVSSKGIFGKCCTRINGFLRVRRKREVLGEFFSPSELVICSSWGITGHQLKRSDLCYFFLLKREKKYRDRSILMGYFVMLLVILQNAVERGRNQNF